jgi:hypothetical protein
MTVRMTTPKAVTNMTVGMIGMKAVIQRVGENLSLSLFQVVLPRLEKSSHDLTSRLETALDSTRLDLRGGKSLKVDFSRLKLVKSRDFFRNGFNECHIT